MDIQTLKTKIAAVDEKIAKREQLLAKAFRTVNGDVSGNHNKLKDLKKPVIAILNSWKT